jgi:hypothetical protein
MSLAENVLKKEETNTPSETPTNKRRKTKEVEKKQDLTKDIRHVDVILSDMCAPPEPMDPSLWHNCLAEPYNRMCNTSGIPFRDHVGSMVCSPRHW